ncbi:hypothetical protein [Clostridium intestinale]|uniref:Uncharacterized protein n=1 Tax=Clostridium intestinale TaxID=36845 RepID=A0A7D6ZJU1_9CLOT|nr:hypothetical protein [Clostridium intestinale]QLY81859.1 hypothetical protein HZF06_09820 [Clostridium intestinale]
MRAIKNKNNKLLITNYEGIDEQEIFIDIFNILKNNSAIYIGKKIIGPSEDIYKCKFINEEFILVYDIGYGVFINSSSEVIIEKLQEILNSTNR